MSVANIYINYLKCQMESLEARENFGLENVSTETLIKMKNSFDAFLEISGKIKEPSDRSVRLRGCIMHSPVSEKENEVMLLQEKQALLNANHISERLRIANSIEEQMQEPISTTDESLKKILRVSVLFNIISSYAAHPAVLSALTHVAHPGFYSGNELIRSQKSGVMDYLILEPLATDLEKSAAVQKLTNQLREISILERLENRESPLGNFKIIESRNIIRLFSILGEVWISKFREEFNASLEKMDLEGDLRGIFSDYMHSSDRLMYDLYPYSNAILLADQIVEWMKREENAKFLDAMTELDIRSHVGSSSVTRGTGITLLPRCIGLLKNLKRLSFSVVGTAYMRDPDDESREISRGLRLLPNSIGNLINLEVIELNGGLLGLPHSIGAMKKLTKITIENDKLLFLPSSMGNLTDLQYLELRCPEVPNNRGDFIARYNQNSAHFPGSLQLLQKLKLFRLEGFRLSVLPTFIGELTGLERLLLEGNQVVEFPEFLRNLTSLKELDISGNPGKNLSFLGSLTNLEALDMQEMGLHKVPEEMGQLQKLIEINFIDNLLTQLPEFMERLNIRKIDLSENEFIYMPKLACIPEKGTLKGVPLKLISLLKGYLPPVVLETPQDQTAKTLKLLVNLFDLYGKPGLKDFEKECYEAASMELLYNPHTADPENSDVLWMTESQILSGMRSFARNHGIENEVFLEWEQSKENAKRPMERSDEKETSKKQKTENSLSDYEF